MRKKLIAIALILIILLVGCGKKDNGLTMVSAPPTATASSASSSATASTTALPENTDGAPEETATEADVTPTPDSNEYPPNGGYTGGEVTDVPPDIEAVNIIDAVNSNFDNATNVSNTVWGKVGSPVLSISPNGYNNTKCLYFSKPANSSASYYTAALNLAKFIKSSGYYIIRFKYKVAQNTAQSPFTGVIRTDKLYSFSAKQGSNYYISLQAAPTVEPNTWATYETSFSVGKNDNPAGAEWNFCMHLIKDDVSGIYIDDFEVLLYADSTTASENISTQTWRVSEVVLISDRTYDDPYNDVDVDLVLTNGSTTYTVPGFWDGGSAWRIRFVCPSAGSWSYTTKCTNKNDTGLHNHRGSFKVTAYSGNLDIYKHGFIKNHSNTKYFMYNDGTPFFYLGDTHWNLSSEPLDNIKTIVDKRVQQGFTVIQSEPLGAAFQCANGISDADIYGFKVNDEKFKYIAEKGMVHVNASFFFPSEMQSFIDSTASRLGLSSGYSNVSLGNAAISGGSNVTFYDLRPEVKEALRKLSRYWVARYGAYPVMWSLGQEVDNDFYWERAGSHDKWSHVNNPYKLVAQYIEEFDAYSHPLSGHQENTRALGNKPALNSAFRNLSSHSWYAVQWSPILIGNIDHNVARDLWQNGQGKQAVLYEGRYCYLWTKNFGARAQGWDAYLSGLFGYGWGGQDTWSYLNTYDENTDTGDDGIDVITSAEKKAATWKDALEYPSTYQMGYMRSFFENTVGDWWKLIPRFDDTDYFVRTNNNVFNVIASTQDHTKAVVYFFNFSDASLGAKPNSSATNATYTGTLKKLLKSTAYNYLWFNPVTGKVASRGTFNSDSSGSWSVPKKAAGDMVLYVYK